MNKIGKISQKFKPLVLFTVWTFLAGEVAAQEEFEFVDLGVEFTNAPATVKINGSFWSHCKNLPRCKLSNIPSSEIISVSVFLRDPNGIILDSHQQSWDGFSQGENGSIAEQGKQQMLFQIPWSQSKIGTAMLNGQFLLN